MIQSLIYFLRIQCVILLYIISTTAHAQIYLYQKDGLLGLKNYNDSSIITEPIYDKINPCYIKLYSESQEWYTANKINFWVVYKNDVCGVLNATGKEVVPISCTKEISESFLNGYIHFENDTMHFLADTTGKIVFQRDSCFVQRNKFIYYRDNVQQKTKFFDYTGKQVSEIDGFVKEIDPKEQFISIQRELYKEDIFVYDFSGKCFIPEGYDRIKFDYPYILCTNYSKRNETELYETVAYSNSGKLLCRDSCWTMKVVGNKYLIPYCKDKNTLHLDSSGKEVIPKGISLLNFYTDFFLGYTIVDNVKIKKLYFYDGRVALDKPVNNVRQYHNRYVVKINDVSYLMDTTGKIISKLPYTRIANSYTLPYVLCDNVIVNFTDGSVITQVLKKEHIIESILHVSDQYYCLIWNRKLAAYGLTDIQGSLVLPPQYKNISSHKDIIAAVDKEDRTTYYSSTLEALYNKIAFREKKELIPDFLYCSFTANNTQILYDRNFKEIFRGHLWSGIIRGYYFIGSTESGKVGLFGVNGEVFIKPLYDEIRQIGALPYYIVKMYNLYGIIDITGKERIPLMYSSIFIDNGGIFRCIKDYQTTTYRITADTSYPLFNKTYASVKPFGKDFNSFIVQENGKFGVVNEKGIVQPLIYKEILLQENNMLSLKKGNAAYLSRKDSVYFSNQDNPSVLSGPYNNFRFATQQVIFSTDKNKDLIVCRGSKYGIINNECKVILDTAYDLILYKGYDLYIVTLNQRSAIFSKGSFLTPMDIDSVFYMDSYSIDQNISFYRNGKYFLLLKNPQEKFSVPYSNIKRYSNGKYVIVENNNRYGVLTNKNTFTLDLIYQNIKAAGPEDELIIQQQGLSGMALENGTIRIPMEFATVQSLYYSPYYRVSKNNLYGIYNNRGKEILPPEYDFIQASGQYYLDQYQKENPSKKSLDFSRNVYVGIETKKDQFIVKQNNQYGVIDSNQHVLIPIQYDFIEDGGPGYIITKNGKSGYADYTGEIILSPTYEPLSIRKVLYNQKDVFYIRQEQKWGVLAGSKIIIQPQYDTIKYYPERQTYFITRNDSTGLADSSGTTILPLGKYEFIMQGQEPYCIIKDPDNRYAIFSFTDKKFLTEFIYDRFDKKYADEKIYVILHLRASRFFSLYIPGVKDSPLEAIYDRILYNENKNQFELYYTSKNDKKMYRTYTNIRGLSKPIEYKE